MKYRYLSMLLLAFLLNVSAFAGLSFNATMTNNYMARGTSQTLGDPAFMFGADYNFDNGFYLGSFTSNVNFNDGTDQEIDGWFGYRKTKGILTFDTSVALYAYTNDPVPYEMFEAKVAFTEVLGKFALTQTLAYSPDYFNILDQSVWGELVVAYTVSDRLTLSTAVGYQYIQGGGSYGCYNVGANVKLTDKASLDLRYYDTNDHGQGKAWENAFAASIRFTF